MSRQFIIQMENRPGELAHMARALAARGIDIRHIATAGAGSCACAFVTTTDADATRAVLSTLGNPFIEGSPILVELDDVPGALAAEYARLAEANVNVLGTLMVGRKPGKVEVAFSVDDEQTARRVLGVTDLVGVSD